MSKNQEASISPAQAIVYFLASIALLVVLYEFRVHLGFLLLILALLALLVSLVLAYLAVFQPEFVKRSASQGVESYLFVRNLLAKVRGSNESTAEGTADAVQSAPEVDVPEEQSAEERSEAPQEFKAEEQEPGSSELQ